MKHRSNQKLSTHHLTFLSLCLASSLILSYLESLIPPLFAIPGIKLGLCNIIIVFVLYTSDPKDAVIVTLSRVALAQLLFGNFSSAVYALAGAFLSIVGMIALQKSRLFSPIVISVCGGVLHNVGQIGAAFIMLEAKAVLWYLPPLCLSGIVTGIIIGFISFLCLQKIPYQRWLYQSHTAQAESFTSSKTHFDNSEENSQ